MSFKKVKDNNFNQKQPVITIITVVLNCAESLELTILSVISQSYKNIEFIIIDGGSTDDTLDIIQKHQQYINYWISEPDKGIYDAWNKAMAIATGDWIAFLGADDIYLEGAIASYVNLINSFGGRHVDYISSRVNLIKNDRVLRTIGQKWNWKSFKKNMNVAHVGSLHNRMLFERYGVYNINYKICGDYELLLRPRKNLQAEFMDMITVNMGIEGVSNTNPNIFAEVARMKVCHGLKTEFGANLDLYYSKIKFYIRSIVWY